jgi:DNA-binding transcriptional LysR family regulator
VIAAAAVISDSYAAGIGALEYDGLIANSARTAMNPEQLPNLETFARAAELNSFTAAARSLGLTQAAVSQRIQALEEALGMSLFHRRGGRVLPTEAGRRLYPYAGRILALHHEARQQIAGQEAPLAAELSLAASSVPGEHLLPQLLSVFRRKYPHVQVRATVSDSQAVLGQVEHGQVQLGLVGKKGDSRHLEYRCFACDTLALVVPAAHPWGRRKRVPLAQLCEQPLILREVGSGSRWCLEQALVRAGMSLGEVRVALELGSNEAIKEAVAEGLGLAVLSTQAVQREVRAGRLHVLAITGLPLQREMFVVWDRRRALPIPGRLFLDLLEPCERGHPGARRKRAGASRQRTRSPGSHRS